MVTVSSLISIYAPRYPTFRISIGRWISGYHRFGQLFNLHALNPTYKKLYMRHADWGSEGVNGRSGEPEKFRRLG